MISVEGLKVEFSAKPLFQDVSFVVNDKDRIALVGKNGAGKSTVCKLVRERLGINLSISATSRKPRNGEQEGVDYFFITAEEFERKIKNDDFLEYANVHGNYYGTLKSEVEERLQRGEKVLLEIDVQGGVQVKEKFPEANLVFFKTPTISVVVENIPSFVLSNSTQIR